MTREPLELVRRVGAAVFSTAALVACSHTPPTTAPAPDQTFEFTAQTTVDTVLTGTFSGSAVVHGQYIDVTMARGSISFPTGEPMRWRGVELHAFVAANYTGGSWTAPVESRPTNLWQYLDLQTKPLPERKSVRILRPLHFVVPIPPGTDLSTSRLALEIEWVALYTDPSKPDLRYGQQESNIAFSGPIVLTRATNH